MSSLIPVIPGLPLAGFLIMALLGRFLNRSWYHGLQLAQFLYQLL